MPGNQEAMRSRWRELAQIETGWDVLDIAARTYTINSDVKEHLRGETAILPPVDNRFDLVTCRNAIHEFPDSYRFMLEVGRVLKPGGLLLLEDTLLPDNERAAGYVNALLRLRDPHYKRAYAGYEWEGTALDAGFEVVLVERFAYTVPLIDPEHQPHYTRYVAERLHILLRQAPQAVVDWLQPHCPGTADAAFTRHTVILKAMKPT